MSKNLRWLKINSNGYKGLRTPEILIQIFMVMVMEHRLPYILLEITVF